MSQYTTGKIKISSSNKKVIIGSGTAFLSNIKKGDIFIIDVDEWIPYIIDSVVSDTEFRLNSPYNGEFCDLYLDYSVTKTFSTLFELPVIKHHYKSFATLVTLYLRMLDSLMKNFGFKNPDEPDCSGGLIVILEPEQARLAGARWYINSDLEHALLSGYKKNLEAGSYQLLFKDIENFATPAGKYVTLLEGETKTITVKYMLIGIPTAILEKLILFNFNPISAFAKAPMMNLEVISLNMPSVLSPMSQTVKYRNKATLMIICGYKISSNTQSPVGMFECINTVIESISSNIVTTSKILEHSGVKFISQSIIGQAVESVGLNIPIINSIKKSEKMRKPLQPIEEVFMAIPQISLLQKQEKMYKPKIEPESTLFNMPVISRLVKKESIVIP